MISRSKRLIAAATLWMYATSLGVLHRKYTCLRVRGMAGVVVAGERCVGHSWWPAPTPKHLGNPNLKP